MKKFKDILEESSLSRIWSHNEKYDCGALTAFRYAKDCGKGDVLSKKENDDRNKKLSAILKTKGYGVTKLSGRYPEGGKAVKENSFFVVDFESKGNLENDLKKLGEEFEQDSILFIPKGAIQNKTNAYLIGTNNCTNSWLGYGNKRLFNKGKLGYSTEIYTSYINGRPFIFETVEEEIRYGNGFASIIAHKIANENI